jgi:hypothetical protein
MLDHGCIWGGCQTFPNFLQASSSGQCLATKGREGTYLRQTGRQRTWLNRVHNLAEQEGEALRDKQETVACCGQRVNGLREDHRARGKEREKGRHWPSVDIY